MKHRRDITSIRISLVRGMGLEEKRTGFCRDYTKHSTGKHTNTGSGQSIAFFWPIETMNWLFHHYSGLSIA